MFTQNLLAVHVVVAAMLVSLSIYMLFVRCIETARVTACVTHHASCVIVELPVQYQIGIHGAIIIYYNTCNYNTLVDICGKKCCFYTFRVASVICKYIFHVNFALAIIIFRLACIYTGESLWGVR